MGFVDQKIINDKLDLVISKLMNLDAPDAAMDRETTAETQKKGLIARDFGIQEWDWPQGVGLYGLMELQRARGTTEYDGFLLQWVDSNLKRGLPSANVNTTAPFLAVCDLAERLDLPELKALCRERAEQLMRDFPRTQENGFEHITSAVGDRNAVHRNREQLWVDTLFMAIFFLTKMAVRCGNDEWKQATIHEYLLYLKYLADKKTGLLYHGWTFDGRHNFGNIFWCRGNSWFTYAAPAYLNEMEGSLERADREFILTGWRNQVDGLLKVQDECGLWHTVLDDPDTYLETSGSAAITAGILYGIRKGYLGEAYKAAAVRAVEALLRTIEADGTVGGVSAGTAIGMNKEHYKNILIHPMAYGQSLTALALTEALYL